MFNDIIKLVMYSNKNNKNNKSSSNSGFYLFSDNTLYFHPEYIKNISDDIIQKINEKSILTIDFVNNKTIQIIR